LRKLQPVEFQHLQVFWMAEILCHHPENPILERLRVLLWVRAMGDSLIGDVIPSVQGDEKLRSRAGKARVVVDPELTEKPELIGSHLQREAILLYQVKKSLELLDGERPFCPAHCGGDHYPRREIGPELSLVHFPDLVFQSLEPISLVGREFDVPKGLEVMMRTHRMMGATRCIMQGSFPP